jgi:hypothetical protein
MASKASSDPITPEPFWFLNPQLGRLAVLERRFVAQWIHDDGAAADWIQNLLTSGWLPWHAGVEIDYLDVRTGPITTLPGTVLRWFWQIRHCTPIEWNSSSTIYVGPSILMGKDPDGFEYPITDSRSRVRIKLHLIRFYHPILVFRLRSDGLMPWSEEPAAEPPEQGVKSGETAPKDEVPGDAEPEHVKYGMPEPRSREQKLIQDFVIKTYDLKWRAVPTDTIIAAASKDEEFKRLVGLPFPSRSTFERALGRKKD